MQMTTLQLLVILAALVLGAESQTTQKVECNHKTTVCECDPENNDGDTIDVCEFSLDIEHLQTFTRYVVDDNTNSRGVLGGVWYIRRDENRPGTGELNAYSSSRPCGNVDLNDPACTQPYTVDGRTFRSIIGVNGQIPGPTLIVNYDQTVVVHVTNRLASESTSIHWHGMHQRKSNVMDGVEHITQCGISPGATFTYIFKASPYGTTWYHSHSGAQRTDGLFGSLVVKENKETSNNVKTAFRDSINITDFIDDPASHTLSFLDWQRKSSIDLFTQIHSSIRFFDEEEAPIPLSETESDVPDSTVSLDGAEVGVVTYWSGLINGKGRHRILDNYRHTRLSIFTVSPNTTYRFRLVGAQSLFAYRVSIDDHKLTVIATDGAFIEPVTVDYIIIHSGERYDFLLTTKTTQELAIFDFIIRAETLEREPNTTEAILHYDADGSPNADYLSIIDNGLSSLTRSCTAEYPCTVLNCPFENYPEDDYIDCLHIHELKLLLPVDNLPKAVPNDRLFFNFGFEGVGRTSAINGRNLQLPSSPLVFREPDNLCTGLETDDTCDAAFNEVISDKCICTHIREVGTDQSVQLVLSAVGPDPVITDDTLFLNAHPIHLHGHYFHVVDIQFGEYDDNGLLVRANEDIECGGSSVCTNPRWKSPPDDKYETENGTISTRAPLKDTLVIPAGGYAVVYFQTDNPGYWFLHCHIEVHQLEGMGVVIREGDTGNKNLPSGFQRECGNFTWSVDEFNKLVNGGTALNSSYLLILILFSTVGMVVGT